MLPQKFHGNFLKFPCFLNNNTLLLPLALQEAPPWSSYIYQKYHLLHEISTPLPSRTTQLPSCLTSPVKLWKARNDAGFIGLVSQQDRFVIGGLTVSRPALNSWLTWALCLALPRSWDRRCTITTSSLAVHWAKATSQHMSFFMPHSRK